MLLSFCDTKRKKEAPRPAPRATLWTRGGGSFGDKRRQPFGAEKPDGPVPGGRTGCPSKTSRWDVFETAKNCAIRPPFAPCRLLPQQKELLLVFFSNLWYNGPQAAIIRLFKGRSPRPLRGQPAKPPIIPFRFASWYNGPQAAIIRLSKGRSPRPLRGQPAKPPIIPFRFASCYNGPQAAIIRLFKGRSPRPLRGQPAKPPIIPFRFASWYNGRRAAASPLSRGTASSQ